jgi:hypothetical protein
MLIQVNMQAGIHGDFGFVLHIRQNVAQPMYSVVVDQSDHPNDLRVPLTDSLLDQVIADQIANRLGTVLITLAADTQIKSGEKILL